MATLEQAKTALLNAHNAGDVESARKLASFIKSQEGGSAKQKTAYDIADSVSMGVLDPVYGIGQIAPRVVSTVASLGGNFPNVVSKAADRSAQRVDAEFREKNKAYETRRGENGTDWWRIAGTVANPINYLGGAPTSVARAAGSGAVGGVTQPVEDTGNFKSEKAIQAGIGALGGAAFNAAGRVLSPQTNPSVKALLKKGVKLTPGEMLGGLSKRMEDSLTSVPVLGDIITSAQTKSRQSMNRAVYKDVLSPIGEKLPSYVQTGREGVEYIGRKTSEAYDELLPKLTGFVDEKFNDDLYQLTKNVADDVIMNPAEKNKFFDILNGVVKNRVSDTGHITGEGLKEIESYLGETATKFSKSLNPSEGQLSDAVRETQSIVRNMLERTNPKHRAELASINKSYALLKRVRHAAGMQGAKEGVFSPDNLSTAVKALDKTKDKRAFAEGKSLFQDWSDPAKSVMSQSVRDSGTAGRLLAPALAGSLATATASFPAAAAGLLPATALAAGYVPGGRRIAQALLTERPLPVRAIGDVANRSAVSSGGAIAKQKRGRK